MDDTENTKYNSTHVLLEMAKDEYIKERERANALDSKLIKKMNYIVSVCLP